MLKMITVPENTVFALPWEFSATPFPGYRGSSELCEHEAFIATSLDFEPGMDTENLKVIVNTYNDGKLKVIEKAEKSTDGVDLLLLTVVLDDADVKDINPKVEVVGGDVVKSKVSKPLNKKVYIMHYVVSLKTEGAFAYIDMKNYGHVFNREGTLKLSAEELDAFLVLSKENDGVKPQSAKLTAVEEPKTATDDEKSENEVDSPLSSVQARK